MFYITREFPQSILANPGKVFLIEKERYQILPNPTFAGHPVIDATHFKP
jgi:hypothetical protein